MPEHLELIAHGATAILATWLGLIVLTRARQQPGARIFAALTGCLVIWSLAIIVEQLSTQPGTVNRSFRAIEDVTAYLLPVGTLHVALALAVEGRRSAIQQGTLLVIYAVSLLVALGAVLFPEQRLAVTPPHLELPGIPGEALGWAWIAARVFILAAALYWICRSLASVGADDARRKQLLAALATVTVGAFGGILRFLPGPADSIPWVGVSIMGLAIVLAAYGVFAQGVFLSPAVAGQAFRYSLVIGLGVTVYVAALIALDRWTRDLLAIDVPIVTAMALVITLALFDPIADRLRRTVRGRTPRQTAYDRLLRALGEDVLTAQRPEGAVVPVLARLSRTFRLLGAAVETKDRVVVAHHGHPVAESPLALRLPLRSVDTDLGWVVFGPKRS
ncbi:MAG TPA: histidine kinase N-terminal 7TM domain-containing protein, partial [Candidatus Limnocylindrales bacterium]